MLHVFRSIVHISNDRCVYSCIFEKAANKLHKFRIVLNGHGARNGDQIEDHALENDPNLVDDALNDQLSEGVIASTHECM